MVNPDAIAWVIGVRSACEAWKLKLLDVPDQKIKKALASIAKDLTPIVVEKAEDNEAYIAGILALINSRSFAALINADTKIKSRAAQSILLEDMKCIFSNHVMSLVIAPYLEGYIFESFGLKNSPGVSRAALEDVLRRGKEYLENENRVNHAN